MLSTPPILMTQKTIYYSAFTQEYIYQTIKKPLLISLEILFDKKANKVQKFKAVREIWKAFSAMKGLPEPTVENTWHPNSHNLIRLRDWICGRLGIDDIRIRFIRRFINFIIIIYDFDPPWRWMMDSVKDEAFKMEWKPRGYLDNWVGTYTWWRE